MKDLFGECRLWVTAKFRHIVLMILGYFPVMAYAQTSESPVGQGLGYIINNFVYGGDGIAICIIAVAGVGLLCLAHMMKWIYFVATIAGVAFIFGAPAIVSGIKSLVHAS